MAMAVIIIYTGTWLLLRGRDDILHNLYIGVLGSLGLIAWVYLYILRIKSYHGGKMRKRPKFDHLPRFIQIPALGCMAVTGVTLIFIIGGLGSLADRIWGH